MKNSRIYNIVTQIICVAAVVLALCPLVLILKKSFSVDGIGNYLLVLEKYDLLPNLLTSMIVVGGTLVVVGIATSMAAFAFSKLKFPYKNAIYYTLLTGMMIPASALIFPLFQIVRGLKLINTPFALIFPYATINSCFNLIILKNYYDGLPNEIVEAAVVDGASKWKVFTTIMLPVAKPGLIFILIQTFLNAWNELQMSMIFINDPKIQPLSVVPLKFIQSATGQGYPIQVMYAAMILCLTPIAIFYLFGSKYLVRGLTAGAVKG